MKYHVNFQYRPKDRERPQDEPMLDLMGKSLNLVMQDGGLLPNIGDHVIFARAGSEYDENKQIVSKVEQIEGIVENRLFIFANATSVIVNLVVTDTKTNWGTLIKE